MHWIALTALLFAVLSSGGSARGEGPALYPHGDVNNWGAWGKDDERGAANYITPERIVAAGKLIQSGRTFSLAIPLDEHGPVFPPRMPPHHTMVITGARGATLTFVAIDDENVTLYLDVDADGEDDVTIQTDWDTLNGDDD